VTASRPRLILGSGSPRRVEILRQIGVEPDEIRVPDTDEDPRSGELPRAYCRRVAATKAAAVPREAGELVLAADTTVALGRRILGKPADATEAGEFLAALSGRRHRVVTAVAVADERGVRLRDVVSIVQVRRLSERDIAGYIATGDWQGKAGGYAIQGPASCFMPWISGSYTAIMGLPAAETAGLLVAAGYPVLSAAR